MTDESLTSQMANFERCVLERDQQLAETVLDEGYALVIVQPAPAAMPRAGWLQTLPDYIVHFWEVQEQTVEIDGDTAAVFQRLDMRATVQGADRSGLFITTDVWRLRDDGWRVWRRYSTPLSAASLPDSS